MDWIADAKMLFRAPKPEHFTDFKHCCECSEHDETLVNADIDTIGLEELGNPAWDPICFCSDDGKKYYMPALIRLSLDTLDNEFYFEQLLFHLESNGANNSLFASCSTTQRAFIAAFIAFMLAHHAEQIERNHCTSDALRTYQIWSGTDYLPA